MTGLAQARNFRLLPHGPAQRRTGFGYVNQAKGSRVRLIPFQFSADQGLVLEFGDQYVRFHSGGQTVLEANKPVVSVVGNTVTVTSHGYSTGQWVYIGGRFLIATSTGADTFTVTGLHGEAAVPTGATCARVYEVATPYVAADLFDLHYVQSNDVLTICHPSYATRELRRLDAANWTLSTVSFAPPSVTPTSVTATPTVAQASNLTTASYAVTGVADDGVTETLQSATATADNNLTLAGNFNVITFTGISGYSRYNVFKLRGGIWGYIGQVRPVQASTVNVSSAANYQQVGYLYRARVRVVTASAHGRSTGDLVFVQGTTYFDGYFQITVEDAVAFTYAKTTAGALAAAAGTVTVPALSMIDDNITPDTSKAPPESIYTLNTGAADYPAAVAYHEQRRWLGGTTAAPQGMWATRSGTETNLTSSVPVQDDDALAFRIASRQQNAIRHIVPLSDLIVFTASGDVRVGADNAPAITPTSLSVKPQGTYGASNVQPVVASNAVLYVQAQGARIRECSYDWQRQGFTSNDASIMAPHLFNGYTITDLAFSRAPVPELWAVRSDGELLCMTYVPDQQVYAWAPQGTDGAFESVCCVSEASEDVPYVVAARTVGGVTYRYIERLRSRIFTDQEDAFFVDSGLTYSGAPATTISGLWHLEGRTVQILADGAVHPNRTVTNGAITLDLPASTVHIGLPYVSDLQTLPLALEAMAGGQGITKNVNAVRMRVTQSSAVKAGPSFTKLTEYPARDVTDNYDSPPALATGELRFAIGALWGPDGAVCVRQDLPLPLTIMSMVLDVAGGG